MRSRIIVICLALAGLLAIAMPGAATAKKKHAKAAKPSITRVTPMRVKVGANLALRGKRFSSKRTRNTVIFRAPSGRTVFVKPRRAGSKKLVVRVPAAVAKLVSRRDSRAVPTRFKLRVLSKKKFSKWTTRRLSPVIVAPSGAGGSGGSCGSGDDWDSDLLANALESTLKTDPCLADSDLDGVEDGYEYKSAIDLNDDEFQDPNETLPYPGKRPYPNPLDGSDAGVDHDGDSLTLAEEQTLWRYTGVRGLFELTYSAGEQYSARTRDGNNRRVPTIAAVGYDKQAAFLSWATAAHYRTLMLADGAPWWNHPVTRHPYGLLDANRDGVESAGLLPGYSVRETTYYDFDNNNYLSDNERDEDADGLTNYDETHGRLNPDYWIACYSQEKPHPVRYMGTDVTDPDTDGDGVRDGADDQDHDDIPNVLELSRVAASGLWDGLKSCRVDTNLTTGNFRVSGGPLPNTSIVVDFVGEFTRQDVAEMTVTDNLVGGTSIDVDTIRDGGPTANERQAITILGAPTGGNFTLTLNGSTTTAIGFDSTADGVESALDAIVPADPLANHSLAYGRVNPFNPCLPADWSRTCTLHPSFENSGAPFDGSVDWYSLN
jgi:hypothetical protein